MNSSQLVSVIIANYNGEKYLDPCLKSLLKTRYQNFEVLIVDDGSNDRSKEIIATYKQSKKIKLLQNDNNLGAAASRNKAFESAKGEIIVFLDNDTEVDPNWLSPLVDTLTKNETVGAAQSLLFDYVKRNEIQVVGVRLWAPTGWGLPIREDKNEILSIAALSAALAVKREVFKSIGGFDEDEAVVTEDLDLSWRIWLSGYKILSCRDSHVFHWTKSVHMRKNLKHTNKIIYFHLTKNSLISITKNYETKNLLRYLTLFSIISLLRSAFILGVKLDSSAATGMILGYVWYVKNIRRIIKKREVVQEYRKFSDEDLFHNEILIRPILSVLKMHYLK